MIQYEVASQGLGMAQVAACEHPTLADLRRHGPWSVAQEQGRVILTQSVPGWTAAGWGEWKPALAPGRRFRLATNPPDLSAMQRKRLARLPTMTVDTACGRLIRIPAALADGSAFDASGEASRPASAYGKALLALLDRSSRGDDPPPQDWLACIRLAIQAGHRLTDDAIHALDLLGHTDLEDYLEAMTVIPKAPPVAGG